MRVSTVCLNRDYNAAYVSLSSHVGRTQSQHVKPAPLMLQPAGSPVLLLATFCRGQRSICQRCVELGWKVCNVRG